ncbi:MAG TPA: TIGR03086 family metal-binding protein [Acidimicrobiales bacterium]|jgi:uncharacterized protein (TIGR03086 family)
MTIVNLEPATRHMADLVAGVGDDLLDRPTPCLEYTLGDLLDHIGGLALAFTGAAAKSTSGPGSQRRQGEGDVANLDDDWRTRIPKDLEALAEAWRDPEAWTGMTQAGGVDLPGEVAGLVVLDELMLHGWDLAQASGQKFEYDPGLLEVVHGFVQQWSGPSAEGQREGMFGPEVPVPSDAPLLDRVIGLSGRDPDWSAM